MSATTSSAPAAPPRLGRASNKPGGFFVQGSTSTARRHSWSPPSQDAEERILNGKAQMEEQPLFLSYHFPFDIGPDF